PPWSAGASLPMPCASAIRGVSSRRQYRRAKKPFRFASLGMHLVEGGNAIVPFKQSRRGANTPDRVFVQLPNRIDHRVVVRIQNVFRKLGVASDVDLCDTIRGN